MKDLLRHAPVCGVSGVSGAGGCMRPQAQIAPMLIMYVCMYVYMVIGRVSKEGMCSIDAEICNDC